MNQGNSERTTREGAGKRKCLNRVWFRANHNFRRIQLSFETVFNILSKMIDPRPGIPWGLGRKISFMLPKVHHVKALAVNRCIPFQLGFPIPLKVRTSPATFLGLMDIEEYEETFQGNGRELPAIEPCGFESGFANAGFEGVRVSP